MTDTPVHDLSDAELMREIAPRLPGIRNYVRSPHRSALAGDLVADLYDPELGWRRGVDWSACAPVFLAHAIAAMAERGICVRPFATGYRAWMPGRVYREVTYGNWKTTDYPYDPTSVPSTTTAGLRAVCDALRMEAGTP